MKLPVEPKVQLGVTGLRSQQMQENEKCVLGILCPTDFIKRQPFGGGTGLVENLFPVFSLPITVFGIGVNGTPAWKPVVIHGKVNFVAVADLAFPARIPMRLTSLWYYFLHRRRILQSGVSVLYIHSPEIALPFLFFNKQIPIIFHQHGSGNPLLKAKFVWARNRFLKWIFDKMQQVIHRRSDWNIVIDRLCLEQARQNGVEEKTTMIMNAVDTVKFRPDTDVRNEMRCRHSISDDHCAILFVGRIEEIKRVDRAIEAMAHLRSEEKVFRLFLAGDGTCRNKLEEYAHQQGLGDVITFFGDVAHDELPPYYNMADLLVLPSEMEGVPMVILESLACGTPVVATNVGGIADIVKNGENGFVLDDAAPPNLAEAICLASRLKTGRVALADSVSHLSTVCFAEELNRIIKKAMYNKKVAKCL
jgi:glycosyltransferase involved in cell wall biosynthesis